MPKYKGKQNFSFGSFPEVGQKKKNVEERAKVNDYNGQYLSPVPKSNHPNIDVPFKVSLKFEKND